ncbi:hypothetical protein [Rhodoferax sp.]|uniref:hypothetical protein n=1 Tax=Rhodoferax sp. TaxID=50421 RepID=UPI0025E1818D|nr:hypothetical protein [Rhodoferax sp.]
MSLAMLKTLFAQKTWAHAELGELHFAAAETDLWFESYLAGLNEATLAESLRFQFTDGDAARLADQISPPARTCQTAGLMVLFP